MLTSGRMKFLYINKSLINYKNKLCIITIVFDSSGQLTNESNHKILDFSLPLLKPYTRSYDGRTHSYVYGSGYDTDDKNIAKSLQFDKDRGRFVHPDNRDEMLLSIQKLLDNGSKDVHLRFRSCIENGKDYMWWNSYMRAESKRVNNQVYTVIHGFNFNVDKQIRNEIDLKIAKEKAEESEHMKSMFLANMSHEIRTPLNAIVGFSSLISEACEEERDEYLNIIKLNSDILINLINDILDLSKIDAGMPLTCENINFVQFFKDLTTSLIHKQNNANVEFIVDSPYDMIRCNIDKNRVGQIITNFVTNAIKHTAKGQIKIEYSYDDGVVELYVEDTGRGIPADKHYLVFQRFQKLDTITRGTGLGLSIVAAIVEHMQGEYGFESKEGVGSRFWVRIRPDITNLGLIKESDKSISYRIIERGENVSESNKINILVAEDATKL